MLINDYIRLIIRSYKHRCSSEKFEINYMLAHLSAGDISIDIGGYKGVYAHWMSGAVGASGKVYCFEPQPVQAEYLKHFGGQRCLSTHTTFSMRLGGVSGFLPTLQK